MTIDHQTKLKSLELARSAKAEPAPETIAIASAKAILDDSKRLPTTAGQLLADALKAITG
jgi:hypothetical protein